MPTRCQLTSQIEQRLLARNEILESFFAREADRLAEACREMSDRFLRSGRLLAFGQGPYATDAQHVSVEFVHPVIVGKRALPALDLSVLFRPWLEAIHGSCARPHLIRDEQRTVTKTDFMRHIRQQHH